MNENTTYTNTAIRLHWLVGIAIIGCFCVGLYMHELPLSPEKLRIYSWHKWAGVSIFALVVLRLVWRLGHRPPPAPATVPEWQHRVAEGVHVLLYILMLAIPLSGWLMSSAKGYQTVVFGLLPLPDLLQKDLELGKQLTELHELLNFSLAGLVLAHVAAALKHYFIDHDNILQRMLPFLKKQDR